MSINCAEKLLSCAWLFRTLQTTARQAPLSMGFFRQEYRSELSSPTPGDLPNPGMEPASPVSSVLAGEFFTTESPWKPKSVSPQERVSVISCLFGSLFHWDLSWWIPLSMFFFAKKQVFMNSWSQGLRTRRPQWRKKKYMVWKKKGIHQSLVEQEGKIAFS